MAIVPPSIYDEEVNTMDDLATTPEMETSEIDTSEIEISETIDATASTKGYDVSGGYEVSTSDYYRP